MTGYELDRLCEHYHKCDGKCFTCPFFQEDYKSRIENDKSRIENDKSRIENDKSRIENDKSRLENE